MILYALGRKRGACYGEVSVSLTLIFGLLADGYAVMASDRRLTWSVISPITGRHTVVRREEAATKTIIICGHMMMGFTGVARFRGMSMERWVAETLRSVEPDPDAITNRTFEALRAGATIEFESLPAAGQRIHHSYLIVGYFNDRATGKLRPARLIISNSLNGQGQLLADPTGLNFQIAFESLGNRRQLLTTVGVPVPRQLRQALDDMLRHAVRRYPDNPAPAADLLIQGAISTRQCIFAG